MFVVTWIDNDGINTRVYSKREYGENLAKWCKRNNFDYLFAEESVDREIIKGETIDVEDGHNDWIMVLDTNYCLIYNKN